MQGTEKNLTVVIHDGIAKEAKKRRDQTILLMAIAFACGVATTAFAIYFATQGLPIGIISFSVVSITAYALAIILIVKNHEKLKEDAETVSLYLKQKDNPKALSAPALDVFCVTSVKVMFVLLSAVIACSVPLCITILQGQSISEIFTYLGNCLGAFWGMGEQDFYSYIIGVGLMSGIFGIILLLIKFVLHIIK